MLDPYLLLTPILLLAVIALVRFVGCDLVFTVPDVPEPPANLRAAGSNHAVDLTWDASPSGGPYRVKSGVDAGGPYPDLHDTPNTFFTDQGLDNGKTRFYIVVAVGSAGAGRESKPSNEAAATPAQALVTSEVIGTPRNDFTGVVGMQIKVAANPLFAVGLGRMFLPGNSGVHQMKVVDATTNIDIPNAATTVDLTAPTAQAGKFVYGLFANPVRLDPNTEYYVVSAETLGADQFADLNTTVLTTADAAVLSAVFGDGLSSYTRGGGPGQTFGPVDLIY